MAEDKELKMETKCYDASEYGYLYGLNQKIPDEEFEKVKPYMRRFKRMDFVEGNIKVTGRPEGYRCFEKDVAKVEEILGIEKTVAKKWENIENKMADPIKKVQLKDQTLNWLTMLFKNKGTQPKQDLSRLAIHSTKIYDPADGFKNGAKDGYGELFIYTPHGMWYVINNCSPGANHALNNLESKFGGAIGFRLMYDDTVDTLIRIYSEENLYTGEDLF
ncbi:hypothetical protein [uncultured Methanobrevibacter sp.]|uniref:hypothetical protein n=1 Tax=uncultured Methanobrevibacter sp. TaxID=253161 RepID=UPI00260D7100